MGSIDAYSTAQGRRYKVRYRTPERRQTAKAGFHHQTGCGAIPQQRGGGQGPGQVGEPKPLPN